jgi:hypothetical protein
MGLLIFSKKNESDVAGGLIGFLDDRVMCGMFFNIISMVSLSLSVPASLELSIYILF